MVYNWTGMARQLRGVKDVELRYLKGVLLVAWLGIPFSTVPAATASKQIAITIDDLDINAEDNPRLSLDQRNKAILATLRRSHVTAALFVCGMRVNSEAGRRHLAAWSTEGHIIANHTYSHFDFAQVGFETFSHDVLHGEEIIRGYRGFRKLLRFPYLKEGATAEQRDQMREFMRSHGYENGYVTIDASDWAIDARMRKRLAERPDADLSAYRAFYLEHIGNRADYYDSLAHRVLHRPVKHTLLIHDNLLAALFLGDLIDMLKAHGWELIDANEAYKDPVFSRAPRVVPAGESIIWALAKESGRIDEELRYPAEDGIYEDKRMNALGL
jgi:peptidoglycan/xylan/chitin deacetylase (PgdA/CDA1 family)